MDLTERLDSSLRDLTESMEPHQYNLRSGVTPLRQSKPLRPRAARLSTATPRRVTRQSSSLTATPVSVTPSSKGRRVSYLQRVEQSPLIRDPNLSVYGDDYTPMKTPNILSTSNQYKRDLQDSVLQMSTLNTKDVLLVDNSLFSKNIYKSFMDICCVSISGSVVIETEPSEKLMMFADLCCDVIPSIEEMEFTRDGRNKKQYENILTEEASTWSLLYHLEKDCLAYPDDTDLEFEIQDMTIHKTPKEILVKYRLKDRSLRRDKLIIDWLENEARKKSIDNNAYFIDNGAWENTLYKLKENKRLGIVNPKMVTELDPDIIYRQAGRLDELDLQDEKLILKTCYKYIRSGRIEEAKTYLVRIGQHARAATLDGWQPAHDPNYGATGHGDCILQQEGNVMMNEWKAACWMYCAEDVVNKYDAACTGALSGNLDVLLQVTSSWQDALWAYTLCSIDVREQRHLQDCKEFTIGRFRIEQCAMPTEYWKNEYNMKTIFQKIASSTNPTVQKENRIPMHQIQRLLILERYAELMKVMADLSSNSREKQLIRFMAHLVLYLSSKDIDFEEMHAETVLRSYIDLLIAGGQSSEVVAFYVSKLTAQNAVILYAKYLEDVKNQEERKVAIHHGCQFGIEVREALLMVVQSIFSYEQQEQDGIVATLTEVEKAKIDSISYLMVLDDQRGDALQHGNTIIREFIYKKKLDAAKEVHSMLSYDTMRMLQAEYRLDDEDMDEDMEAMGNNALPASIANSLREFVCFSALFEAYDSYKEFYISVRNKPATADINVKQYGVHNRKQYERKFKNEIVLKCDPITKAEELYRFEVNEYKNKLETQSINTESAIKKVLEFPFGWLIDEKQLDVSDMVSITRQQILMLLRHIYIPDLIKLLMSVYVESDKTLMYYELLACLMDTNYCLYKWFKPIEVNSFIISFDEGTKMYRLPAGSKFNLGGATSTPDDADTISYLVPDNFLAASKHHPDGVPVSSEISAHFYYFLECRLSEHSIPCLGGDSSTPPPPPPQPLGLMIGSVPLSDDEYVSADEA